MNLPDFQMPLCVEAPYSEEVECLHRIARIPNLRTLRSYNWPVMPDYIHDDIQAGFYGQHIFQNLVYHRYMPLLDGFATTVLSLFRSIRSELGLPPLKALCFLESHFSPASTDDTRRVRIVDSCYIPVKQTDASSQAHIIGKRVLKRDLKYLDGYYQGLE